MNIIEHIIDKCMVYYNCVLFSFEIVFYLIIVEGLPLLKKKLKYEIKNLSYNIYYIIIIITTGKLFYLLDLTPKIEYRYFNIVFFSFAIADVILYGILQYIKLRKFKSPLLQLLKYIQRIVYFEIFLLTVSNQLELIEALIGGMGVVSIEIIVILFGDFMSGQKEEIEKKYDLPNPDLFFTRRRQLEKFVPILEQQRFEPYAVMISGEWGMGKSSFVMALEKKLSDNKFIWVKTGSEKSVSEVMMEISRQLLDALREEDVYIEREDFIEKYFLAFASTIYKGKIKLFENIIKIMETDKEKYSRDYINNKLKQLNKTIYLVIDDLDRCDKDYQSKMFKVIRESTELTNCKTIFLVDKSIFLKGKRDIDINYIEKYISYTLDLCKVEYPEIVDFFIDDILDDEFIKEMNPVLLNNRNAGEIRRSVREFPNKVFGIKIDNEHENKNNNFRENVPEIKKNITNSRKVKNYLKGIKIAISNVNIGLEDCGKEFKRGDWLDAIIVVQFMKNFLPKTYMDIKMCESLSEFISISDNSSIVSCILGVDKIPPSLREINESILNYIIYEIDIIDFQKVKTEYEKNRDELWSEEATISHIVDYVNCAETYEDLYKILEICDEQEFDNELDKENYIEAILGELSTSGSFFKVRNEEFLIFSRRLIESLNKIPLSEKEINICKKYGYEISEGVMNHNLRTFVNVLHILYPCKEEIKIVQGDSAIDKLNEKLDEIDNKEKPIYLGSETDKFVNIKRTYINFESKLKKEKDNYKRIDLDGLFSRIHIVFELYEFWNNLEDHLKNGVRDENLEPFYQYFLPNGVPPIDYKVVFFDENSLKEALHLLKKFYKDKKGKYELGDLSYLEYLSYRMVERYEGKPEWFQDGGKECGSLLDELANMVCQRDKDVDEEYKDMVDEISIYVFKFNEYCGNNEGSNDAGL